MSKFEFSFHILIIICLLLVGVIQSEHRKRMDLIEKSIDEKIFKAQIKCAIHNYLEK